MKDDTVMPTRSTSYQNCNTTPQTFTFRFCCMKAERWASQARPLCRRPMRIIWSLAAVIVQVVNSCRTVLRRCQELVRLCGVRCNTCDVLHSYSMSTARVWRGSRGYSRLRDLSHDQSPRLYAGRICRVRTQRLR